MNNGNDRKRMGRGPVSIALTLVMAISIFSILALVPGEVSANGAALTIIDPVEGQINYRSTLEVRIGLSNFILNGSAMGGPNVEGEGHYHLFINGDMVGMFATETVTLMDLPAGDHQMMVELVNNDHSPLTPTVMAMRNFTISSLRPMVGIDHPSDMGIIYSDSMDVKVSLTDFVLNGSAMGGANMEGEGHLHVYINDNMVGMYGTDTVTLSGLPAGDHVLKVEIVNNDHTPLIGNEEDFIHEAHFTISDLRPMIDIVSPIDSSVLYQDHLDLEVMVTDLMLNSSAIGMENMEGEGHYHILINDVLVGPYTDTMVTLSDLPAGDHILKVSLHNNDHTPIVPSSMDMLHFTISDMRPMIEIMEPMDGDIFYRDDLDIEVLVTDFMLNGSAVGMDNIEGEGHYHVYINDALIGPYADAMVTLNDLPAGDHMLKVVLMNNDHTMLTGEGMFMDMVNFTIVDTIPSISIVKPLNGTIVYSDTLHVEVDVDGFMLNGSAIGMANKPGEGHYHLYINDALIGPFTDTMVTLDDLPAGDHVLKVMLMNNDHTMLTGDGMYMDMVHFTISDLRPQIKIMDPMDGAIFYDDMLHLAVEVMNFTLNGSMIGMENMVGEGHYHVYMNGDLVGPFNETMIMLEDLPAGQHELKVMLMNNDHTMLSGDGMFMDMVHFTLSDLRPMIEIVSPSDGMAIYGNDLAVTVDVTDLTMNGSAIGMNNTVGEGHWHLYINDGLIGPYTGNMVTLTDLPYGHHVLKVMLVNNDHSPVMPQAHDMAEFHLLKTPMIEITSPANGTTVTTDSHEFMVSVTDFVLNGSAIGKANMPGEGHYHVYLNDVLVGPFSTGSFTLENLTEGTHVVKVELRNNDHSALPVSAMDMVTIMVDLPASEISIRIGPFLDGEDPMEGVKVTLSYGGIEKMGMSGADGYVTIAVPADWAGMEIEYMIEKDGYETMEGKGILSETGSVQGLTDLSLDKEDDGGSDPLVVIILVVLAVLVIIAVILIVMRGKPQEAPAEE